MLWTFAAAYHVLGDDDATARRRIRAGRLCHGALRRPRHGGVFWTVDAAGRRTDDRKHVYAQAFAIYALSEHTPRDGRRGSAARRRSTSSSSSSGTRTTRCTADMKRRWPRLDVLDDARLSADDADERTSMNTHLHLLEAYTNLYARLAGTRLLRAAARWSSSSSSSHTIVDGRATRAGGFFESDWTPRSTVVSYGHDIESGWLVAGGGGRPRRRLAARARVPRAGAWRAQVLDEGFDDMGDCSHDGPRWARHRQGVVAAGGSDRRLRECATGDRRDAFLEAAQATWAFVKRQCSTWSMAMVSPRVHARGVRPGHEKVGRGSVRIITRAPA